MPLKLETRKIDKYKLVSYCRETPDGTMYVQIYEDTLGNLVGMDLQIGKAGSSLRAYLSVISKLITLNIENGISIHQILEITSNQTSDRVTYMSNGRQVKSAMEALFYILTSYSADKVAEEDAKKHLAKGYFTNPKQLQRKA